MITLIHAADLHLDSPFRELSGTQAAQRRREQRELPGRLADLARETQADLVLLSGDLFDGAHLYRETGEALLTALARINCPVFIAPGNHDPLTSDSPYRTLPWPEQVHIFSGEQIGSVPLPQLGCVVHGCAFTSPIREDDPLAGFTAPDDGQIHLMALHGDVGGRQYAPISPSSIANSGLDYLALGHVHAFSGLRREGNTCWAYPGCPEGRGFDELSEKGALVVEVERGKTNARFVPLCKRRYEALELDLTGINDPLSAARAALTGQEENICRLILTGETAAPPDLNALQAALAGACFSLSLRDRTTPVRHIWDRAQEDSLTGLFLRDMAQRLERAQSPEDKQLLELAVRFGLAALEQGEDCRP